MGLTFFYIRKQKSSIMDTTKKGALSGAGAGAILSGATVGTFAIVETAVASAGLLAAGPIGGVIAGCVVGGAAVGAVVGAVKEKNRAVNEVEELRKKLNNEPYTAHPLPNYL